MSLVVLARADHYEDFDRPALDDPRVRELAAAEDVAGLRRLLLDRARAGGRLSSPQWDDERPQTFVALLA